MNYVWLLAVFGVILYILIMRSRMKRISSVEIDSNKITIIGKKGLLCFKKSYQETIEINKIAKIVKIFEGQNHELFTGIRLYSKIAKVFGKEIDELDYEILYSDTIQQEIEKNSLLAVITACNNKEDLYNIYDKLITNVDTNKVEVEEMYV